MEQMIESAAEETDVYLQTYELLSSSFSSHLDVRMFLEIDPDDAYQYYYYSNQIQKYASNSIQSIINLYHQLNIIYVVGHHGRSVLYENQNLVNIDPARIVDEYRFLNSSIPSNGEIAILGTSVRPEDRGSVVTMARRVRGAFYGDDYKGIVGIEIKLTELSKIWERYNVGEDGYFFIVDHKGNYIYRPNKHLDTQEMNNIVSELINEENNKVSIKQVDEEEKMFAVHKSDYSNWYLIASVSMEKLRHPVSQIRSTTIAIGLITLVVALFFSYRFGQSILSPIRAIRESMRKTEKGKWQKIEDPGRTDEIGELIRGYNLMVTSLSEMIERVYEAELKHQKKILELQRSEIERKSAELQSLQMQINPHFLYNTLETINCYAIVQDSEEITEIVDSMASMLRYSLETNLEKVTLESELDHLHSYMTILSHRTGKDFEVELSTPSPLLEEKMVRFTLQPLIENVFQHGFTDGIEPHHYIKISARHEGRNFLLVIEDNGNGIHPERLVELQNHLEKGQLSVKGKEADHTHRSGIGLINVHRRIQMVFGNQYGLRIQSEWGNGCKIIITLPRRSDKTNV